MLIKDQETAPQDKPAEDVQPTAATTTAPAVEEAAQETPAAEPETLEPTAELKFVAGKLHQRVIVHKGGSAAPEWRAVPEES